MRLVVKNLIPGNTYNLQARAKNESETSSWSRIFTVRVASQTSKPVTPTGLELESVGDSFHARWYPVTESDDGSPATDLVGYVVRFRNVITGQQATFETTGTSFELTFNLNVAMFTPPAGQVGVRVAAKNIAGNQSDWSDEVIAQNPPPDPVRDLGVESILDGIAVKWVQPEILHDDFKEYRAYVGTSADFEPTPGTMFWAGVSTSATYHTQSTGTDFYIKVVVVDKFESESLPVVAGPVSPRGSVDSDTIPPPIPDGVDASISGHELVVSWLAVDNKDNDLAGYRVAYRPTGTSAWSYDNATHEDTQISIVPITRFIDYEVRVQSFDFSFNYSGWSTTAIADGETSSPPATPTGLEFRGAITSAMVFWNRNAEENLSHYEVQFKNSPLNESDPVFTTTATAMSFSENVSEDTLYYTRVRAVNTENQASSWTNTVTGTVGYFDIPDYEASDGVPPSNSPIPNVASGIGFISLQWAAVENNDLVTYEVHVGTSASFSPGAGTRVGESVGTFAAVPRLPDGNALDPDTNYYFKLVAKDVDGAASPSGASAPVKVTRVEDDFDPIGAGIPQIYRYPTIRPETAPQGSLYYDENDRMYMFIGDKWEPLNVATDSDLANTITSYENEYAVSSSDTTPPTTGWSTDTPNKTPGTFIWFRTAVTYGDGRVSRTNPALLTGNPGEPGTPAPSIDLNATTQVLVSVQGGGATTPSTSTITGVASGTSISSWNYSVDGGTFSETAPAGVSRNGNTVTITGSSMTARTISVRASDDNGISDTVTVARVADGADGSGANAYTIVLTNESQVFPGNQSSALDGSTTTQVIAYDGTTQVPATIGTITGHVDGLTTSVSENNTNNPTVTVNVTTSLTTRSGELTIPITVKGITFTKKFSWSLALAGAPGDEGDPGIGIEELIPYYRQVSAGSPAPGRPTTNPPPSEWKTTEPDWVEETTLYRTELIVYTDDSFAYTPVTKVSSYDGIDLALRTANGKNKVVYSPNPPNNAENTVGDIWFQRDANGVIVGQWEGLGDINWAQRTIGNAVIAHLDAGKITTGYLDAARIRAREIGADKIRTEEIAADEAFITNLVVSDANIINLSADKIVGGEGLLNDLIIKSKLTLGTATTNGIIESHGYDSTQGVRIDKSGITINSGSIAASALNINFGRNMMLPEFADFEGVESVYANMPKNSSFSTTLGVYQEGVFGNQSLIIANSGFNIGEIWARAAHGADHFPIYQEADKEYILSFYIRALGTGIETFTIAPKIVFQSGQVLSSSPQSIDTSWKRLSFVFSSPIDGNALVEFNLPNISTGGSVLIDGVQLEEKTGNSNSPSAWHPPSSTSINGGLIRTGEIRSNQNIVVNGAIQPMWSINMNGGMQIGSALIRGGLTVGTLNDSTDSYIQSANYNHTGKTGFILRGADGYAEFRKLVVTLNTSIDGSIIVGNTSPALRAGYVQLDHAGLVSYGMMEDEGVLIATPIVSIGNYGETRLAVADETGEIRGGFDSDGSVIANTGDFAGDIYSEGKIYINGGSVDPVHDIIEFGPVINGQALLDEQFLRHMENHPRLGAQNKLMLGLSYGNIRTEEFSISDFPDFSGVHHRELVVVSFDVESNRVYTIHGYAGPCRAQGGSAYATLSMRYSTGTSPVGWNTGNILGTDFAYSSGILSSSGWITPSFTKEFVGAVDLPVGQVNICMYASNHTGTLNWSGQAVTKLSVTDNGRSAHGRKPRPTGHSGSTSAPPSNPTPAREYTTTFYPGWTQVFSPFGVYTSHRGRLIAGMSGTGSNNVYRSYTGNYRSSAGTAITTALSGATVVKVEVWWYHEGPYQTSSIAIGTHGTNNLPTSAPAITHRSLIRHQRATGKWYTLPTSTHDGWRTGTIRGISFGRTSGRTSAEMWAEISNTNQSTRRPKMRITYRK